MSSLDKDRAHTKLVVGQQVVAMAVIAEGTAEPNPAAGYPQSGYIHAHPGDEGVVVGVDDGVATVAFKPARTATIVGDSEVQVVPILPPPLSVPKIEFSRTYSSCRVVLPVKITHSDKGFVMSSLSRTVRGPDLEKLFVALRLELGDLQLSGGLPAPVEPPPVKTDPLRWDEAIEWENDRAILSLTREALEEAKKPTKKLVGLDGDTVLVRVLSVRAIGSTWLVMTCGSEVEDMAGEWENLEDMEMVFGWTTPKFMESLPEFEGW